MDPQLMPIWWVSDGAAYWGPMSLQEIHARRVPPSWYVWMHTLGQWVPLGVAMEQMIPGFLNVPEPPMSRGQAVPRPTGNVTFGGRGWGEDEDPPSGR
jgi:hypothetical protein